MSKHSYDHLFKILLIGDSGVGKTSIMCRFKDDTFNPSLNMTIGVDFKIKTIEVKGKLIKLQIWDTAGQERFQSITSGFYRGAMGIMLVYDVTNEISFQNINRWMRNIQEHGTEGVVKMIIGNKCDIETRAVIKDRAEALCIKCGIPFFEVSAKSNINIEASFSEITVRILEKQTKLAVEEKRVSLVEFETPKPKCC